VHREELHVVYEIIINLVAVYGSKQFVV